MRAVVVFSGGGAKSLAEAGAWKAIRERGLEVVHIVGTSMGAVVGAAFAAGSTYEQFLAAAGTLRARDVTAPDLLALARGPFASAIFKADPLRRSIARLVGATRFADLKIPLTVTTTDVGSGELVLFGSLGQDGPLVEVLYASCALPLYFPPARVDGRRLCEGGLRAVLPLAVARRVPADVVVAVHVGPGFDEPVAPRSSALSRLFLPPLVRTHGEALRVMMAAQVERAIAEWPAGAPRLVVVRPVAEREATFAFSAVDRYLRAGYEDTRRALAALD